MHRATKCVMHRMPVNHFNRLYCGQIRRTGPRTPAERIEPTITQQEDNSWLFEWDNGALPCRIYLDGKLIATVTTTREYEFHEDGYLTKPPPLEIVGDNGISNSELFPTYAILQWRGTTDAVRYKIQEYVNSSWITRRRKPENGSGTYTYETAARDDLSSNNWRIIAVDSGGRGGTALEFDFIIIRNPAPPDVDYDIDAGTLTVSDAS